METPEPGLPLGRLIGAVAASVVACALVLALAVELLGDEPQDLTTVTPGEEGPPPRVTVRTSEQVRMTVEVDGERIFHGWLCARAAPRCEQVGLYEAPGGARVAVTLGDLTRVTVRYDGRLVEPLGNLSAGRRLVFLEDG